MKLIELDNCRKVGVSFETESNLYISNNKRLEVDLDAKYGLEEIRVVTLELLLPYDSSFYGALGAKYTPISSSKKLHMEVRYTDSCSENYKNTLAFCKRTVFKGLPKQYVECVLRESTNYLKNSETPCGKIVFDTAAYCEVGSSPLIFRILTKIVLASLFNEEYPVPEINIRDLCDRYLLERKGI